MQQNRKVHTVWSSADIIIFRNPQGQMSQEKT